MVAQDPDNPEDRVVAVTKCNVATHAPSLRFRLSPASGGKPEAPWTCAKIDWLGQTDATADELVQPRGRGNPPGAARSEAADFLSSRLADGPVSANEIKKEADSLGLAEATLGRAKQSLRIESHPRQWFEKRGIPLSNADPEDRWFWWTPKSNVE